MREPTRADGGSAEPLSAEGQAALAEWKRLLDAGDTDLLLQTAAQRLIDIAEPAVADVSEAIEPPALDVPLICRCVVKRAFDAARAIQVLIAGGLSYNALALLRPTCEDFFFVSFLLGLPREGANRYVVEKARLEIQEGLRAQDEFFPKMRERFGRTGDPPPTTRLARLAAAIDHQKDVVSAIGRELGWRGSTGPRVKYMAEQVEALAEYDFLYRAASSSVHASLHHLFRMVWGNPNEGVFSVSNNELDRHYSRFALIYGTWLMDGVLGAAARELPELNHRMQSDAYGIWLATLLMPTLHHNAPGLVTKYELRWDGPPLPDRAQSRPSPPQPRDT